MCNIDTPLSVHEYWNCYAVDYGDEYDGRTGDQGKRPGVSEGDGIGTDQKGEGLDERCHLFRDANLNSIRGGCDGICRPSKRKHVYSADGLLEEGREIGKSHCR